MGTLGPGHAGRVGLARIRIRSRTPVCPGVHHGWVPHFPGLTPDERRRLAARGIDAEASCEALLARIRDGSFRFELRKAGLPVKQLPEHLPGTYPVVIPMAVVIP